MGTTKTLGLPPFFNYKEENTDDGYESIQDFYLSWTLRCADEKYKNKNIKLHEYARNVVFSLIYGRNNNENRFIIDKEIGNDFQVINVKTKRQFKKIDLIAEIEIKENSDSIKYILNIENKFYSRINDSQLQNSSEIVENEYGNKGYKIIHLVIFCDYTNLNEEVKRQCEKNNFSVLTIEDIKEFAGMEKGTETGNALFDEYWFLWNG